MSEAGAAMVPCRMVDQPKNGRVLLLREGKIVSIYHYHPYLFKPYLYPVIGPYGKNLTQDQPSDHLHHRSIWYAHHEVNGISFYYESGDEGRIAHQRFVTWRGELDQPYFVSENAWIAPDGSTVLTDRRRVGMIGLPDGEWYLDLSITLIASHGDVVFSDTKEAGLPLVRVADEIDEIDGGRITSGSGATGEEATFGTRSPWVDYSGPVRGPHGGEGGVQGITLMDHPSNANHPPGLFTRSYGPISTREGFMFEGGLTLRRGERHTLRTRLYIHRGPADLERMNAHFERYARETLTGEGDPA